jgi:hypothetical protein
VLVGAGATPDALVRALVDLQRRVRYGDAVLLHLDAPLAADSSAITPSLVLSGGEVRLSYLDRLVRALEPAVVLSSSHVAPGYTWQAPLPAGLGAPNPPGCIESSALPVGRVVDLGSVAVASLLAALSGEADRDADGVVSVAELLAQVGITPAEGLLPSDPHGEVIRLGEGR